MEGGLDFNASTIPANALEDIIEKHPTIIRYFNLIRIFPELKKNLESNFNKLFPNSKNAFSSIAKIPFIDTRSGYEFYEAVSQVLEVNTNIKK
jgi:hypothetical protein